jgi:hypothetical protein
MKRVTVLRLVQQVGPEVKSRESRIQNSGVRRKAKGKINGQKYERNNQQFNRPVYPVPPCKFRVCFRVPLFHRDEQEMQYKTLRILYFYNLTL